ncbi:MAG TPA: hypothetical protein VGJ20_00330 [Xanthobacteraceae bacterium]|jgi:hypothetical protein
MTRIIPAALMRRNADDADDLIDDLLPDEVAHPQQENDNDDLRPTADPHLPACFLLGSVVIAEPELADAGRRGFAASEANAIPRFWWLWLL